MATPSSMPLNSSSILSSTTSSEPIVLLNLPIATKLTRNNFLAWQSQILPLLHGYDLYRYVSSPSPDPTVTNGDSVQLNPAYVNWHKQDQLILGWLRSSLSEPILAQVVSCATSSALWSMLHHTFSASSQARLISLQQQLQGITKGGLSCADYIQKIRSIADELAFIGAPVSDSDLTNYTLRGLGTEYNPLVLAVTARSESISFPDLHALMLVNEHRLNSQHASPPSLPAAPDPAAFYSNPRSRNPRPNFSPQPYRNFGPRPQRFPRPNNFFPRPNNYFRSPSPNYRPPLLPRPPYPPMNPLRAPAPLPPPQQQQPPQLAPPTLELGCQICGRRNHQAGEC